MKKSILFIVLVSMCFVWEGCSTRRNITSNPSEMTDFAPGQVYQLKRPAWLWHSTRSMRYAALMPLIGKEPADSEGIVNAGTRLVIKRVEFNDSFETGPYTQIFAEITTGEYQNKTVRIKSISITIRGGYTKRDPEMLEPVENLGE